MMTGQPYIIRADGEASGSARQRPAFAADDVAGVVDAVGDGVTDLKAGDEVFGWCLGSFAEFGPLANQANFLPKPANLSFEQAAAVPISGMTALQAGARCRKGGGRARAC